MSSRKRSKTPPSPRTGGVYGKESSASSTSEEISVEDDPTTESSEKISEISESSESSESVEKGAELGEKPTSHQMIKRFKAYIEESRGGVKFLDGDTMQTNIYSEFIIDDLIFFYDVYNSKKPYTRFANIEHLLISRVAPDPEETLHIIKSANVERRFHIPGHKGNADINDVITYIENFLTPDGKKHFKAQNDVPYEPFTRGFIDRYHNDYTEQKPIIINPNDILVYVDVYKDYFFHFDQKNLIPCVFISDDVRDDPNDNDELFYYRSEVENRIPAYRPIEIIGGVYKLSEDFLPVSINAALRDVLRYLETICFQLRIDWEQKQIAIKEKTESLIKTASKQLTKSESLKEKLTVRSEKKKKQKESALKKTFIKEVLPSELGGRKQPQEEFAETRKTMKRGATKAKSRRFEADEPVEMAEEYILPTTTTTTMVEEYLPEEIAISQIEAGSSFGRGEERGRIASKVRKSLGRATSRSKSPLKSTIRTSQIASVKKPSGVTFKRELIEEPGRSVEEIILSSKKSPKKVSPKKLSPRSISEVITSSEKGELITEIVPKKKRQYKKRATKEIIASPKKKRVTKEKGARTVAEVLASSKKGELITEVSLKKKPQPKKRTTKETGARTVAEVLASSKKGELITHVSLKKKPQPKKRTTKETTIEVSPKKRARTVAEVLASSKLPKT